MKLDNSILKDTRQALGIGEEVPDFDTDILQHINTSISRLNQNGIGMFIIVEDDTTTWRDLQNPEQLRGNKYFSMVPLFITLSTKILFDPPPPSSVAYHDSNVKELLWRLKIAYEEV